MNSKNQRKKRIRAKIAGTAARPRVSVFISNRHWYLQAIDDEKGVTVATSSNLKTETNISQDLAKKLQAKKIKKVVFDRSGYKYHGRVKIIADDLRAAGLEF